jgi:hypothetical protein
MAHASRSTAIRAGPVGIALVACIFLMAACGWGARTTAGSRAPVETFKVAHKLHVGHADIARRASSPSVVLATTFDRVVAVSVPNGPRRRLIKVHGAKDGLKSASWAPDGRSFVVPVGYGEVPREARLVVVQFPSGPRTAIRDPAVLAPSAAAFSPDGRYLVMPAVEPAVADEHPSPRRGPHTRDVRGLYAYDLRRHRRVRLLYGPVLDQNLSWSPDGKRIAFTSDTWVGANGGVRKCCDSYVGDKFRGGIVVLYVHTGAVKQLTNEGSDPAFSPDGTRIAFVSARGGVGKQCGEDGCDVSAEIDLIRTDGSDRRRLTHTSANERTPSWSPDGSHLVAEAASGDYYSELSRLITLRADGSCYRALTSPSDSGSTLGPNAWQPTRPVTGSEPAYHFPAAGPNPHGGARCGTR